MKLQNYIKNKQQPMASYNPLQGLPFGCSISEADDKNGSPKIGDMIAVNPDDETDTWLVAEKFFKDNYILASCSDEGGCGECDECMEESRREWISMISPSGTSTAFN